MQAFKIGKETKLYNDLLSWKVRSLIEYMPSFFRETDYIYRKFFHEDKLYILLNIFRDYEFEHEMFEPISMDEYYLKKEESEKVDNDKNLNLRHIKTFKIRKGSKLYNDTVKAGGKRVFTLIEYMPDSFTEFDYRWNQLFFKDELYIRLAIFKDHFFEHEDFEPISMDEYERKVIEEFRSDV